MLKIKPGLNGCRLLGMQPELLLGLIVANDVFERAQYDMTVTCISDSKHSNSSLHYVGFAADISLPPIDNPGIIIKRIKDHLGDDFDVVLENDHIHMEYQPKRGVNLDA